MIADRLEKIDSEIAELFRRRAEAQAELISDLEWTDTPTLRVPALGFMDAFALPGELVHVIEQTAEASTYQRLFAHRLDVCDHLWCDQTVGGSKRSAYSRKGAGFVFTYLGEWEVVLNNLVEDDRVTLLLAQPSRRIVRASFPS